MADLLILFNTKSLYFMQLVSKTLARPDHMNIKIMTFSGTWEA